MDVKWKRRGGMLALVCAAGMGCNPILAPFLLGREESKTPAEFELKQPEARKKAKEDARVLVIVSMKPLSSEVAGADKVLASEFVKVMEDIIKENKQKVQLVQASAVEKFKSDNTGWPLQSRLELGAKFKADYVIEMEIAEMKLYEPGSGRNFLKGQSAVSVSAYDVSKGTEEPTFKTEVNLEFPRGRLVEADSVTLSKFQSEFMKKLALELAWKFTDHETKSRFAGD